MPFRSIAPTWPVSLRAIAPEPVTLGRDLALLSGINALVVAGLLAIHGGFLAAGKNVTLLPICLLIGRLALAVPELVAIRRLTLQEDLRKLRRFYLMTTAANLLFAFILSNTAHLHDTHYHVLILVPILATAIHASFWMTLAVAAIGSSFGFAQVFIYFHFNPPVEDEEYFEAAEICIMFLVVACLTWLLISRVRTDRQRLAASLQALKDTQSKLVEQERIAAVGQLAGSIAHEIRNPVAMISSSLQMYARDGSTPETRAEMLRIAQGESARLERITTDFLSYARTRPPARSLQALFPQAEYLCSVVRPQAAARGIDVEFRCPSDLTAFIDSYQLQQAVVNLLLNAVEASSSGAKITLECFASSDGGTLLTVSNPGPRIQAEHAGRIFDPFYTTKGTGTGLGLAIAVKIAEAHGGWLQLTENNDKCVSFLLKLGPTTAISAGEPKVPVAAPH